MAKNFKVLTKHLDEQPGVDEARATAQAERIEELDSVVDTLGGIRRHRHVTQVELARQLGCAQSVVSSLEHQDDMLLSTAARYIAGLGGELHLVAAFPNSEDITVLVKEPTAD